MLAATIVNEQLAINHTALQTVPYPPESRFDVLERETLLELLAYWEAQRPKSYVIADAAGVAGGQSITCLTCGRTSYSPHDVRERYCAACKTYHELP